MAMQKQTKQKLYIALGAVVIFGLLMWLAFSGGNWELLKSILTENLSNDELREQLMGFGWRGYIVITVLSMLQVVCAFLPAEPVQVLAGYTFGFPIGVLLCTIGVLIGNTLIYMLQKIFGERMRGFFIKKLKLDLEKIAMSSKATLIIFILYFLPAIPYGMICFFAASIGMSYRRFLIITGLGALPSVCIGVALGYVAVVSDTTISLCIFAALILLLVLIGWKKDLLFSKVNDYAAQNKRLAKNKVRKANGLILTVAYGAIRAYLWLCGVKIKTVNKAGIPDKPSIILCNHGSFVDFIYAGVLVRKLKPHFIVARLYFYNKYLGSLLRNVGAFPKSMFATDLENARNCMTVLREKQYLAMMPEARLSTVGRFEDIQDATYAFLKKAGVSIYTIKIRGDYFADPKWGKGFRRGAEVEAELDILYTAEQVAELSLEQLRKGVEQRLGYDEFQWLQSRPHIRYRCKKMAEGLENILAVCPVCGQKHTITTKDNKVFCQHCGELTWVDERYQFAPGFRFQNFAQWYDWQMALLEKQILTEPEYVLSEEVELRLPSYGKGLTRFGGKGVCKLSRDGLTYTGSKDGQQVQLNYPLQKVYRVLFGAGQNFEIYDGTEILYFVPEDKRTAVDWYMASTILYDHTVQPDA